jgi:predicted outer membrane repeat protein
MAQVHVTRSHQQRQYSTAKRRGGDCAAGSGADTITFGGSGIGTITLGSVLDITDTNGLTINGASLMVTVGGADLVQVMEVEYGASLTLNSLQITHGHSASAGGGIVNYGTLILINSIFAHNSAASGGAVSSAGTLTISDGLFSFNSATDGGAVSNGGTMTITSSVFSDNSALAQGGGLAIGGTSSTSTIRNSTFLRNSAGGAGGGILNFSTLTIANSTFSGNSTTGNNGGGMANGGTATILNSTFSGNSAAISGGALDMWDPGSGSTTTIVRNTILANSTAGGDCANDSPAQEILDGGNNIIETTSSCTSIATLTSDPNLDNLYVPLLLLHHAAVPSYFPLKHGSPAIDAGDDTVCAAASVNSQSQNGLIRPQGPHCDIGSYEVDAMPTVLSVVRADTNPTNAASVNFIVTFSEPVTGVDASDFNPATSGISGASVATVSGGPTAYTVAVNTGSDSGSIRLDVPAGASITDLSGNPLSNLPYTSGEAYSMDKLAPSVVSVALAGTSPTNAASVNFSITFSEPVTSVDASDFNPATSGISGASVATVSGGPTAYTVAVNTGSGNGSIRLDVPAGASITDISGNPAAGLPYTGDATYTIDKTTTLTLNSIGSQDGWVLESGETSNKGGTRNSNAKTLSLGDDAARKQFRAILSFKTGTQLPSTAVITGVTLNIKKQGIFGSGNPLTIFKGFIVDVKNGAFGTAALQAGDFQAAASHTYGPFKPAPVSDWYSIDLSGASAYINKLSTGSGLTQIRLRFKLDDNNNAVANILSLYSGSAAAAFRPQLIISYYVP